MSISVISARYIHSSTKTCEENEPQKLKRLKCSYMYIKQLLNVAENKRRSK